MLNPKLYNDDTVFLTPLLRKFESVFPCWFNAIVLTRKSNISGIHYKVGPIKLRNKKTTVMILNWKKLWKLIFKLHTWLICSATMIRWVLFVPLGRKFFTSKRDMVTALYSEYLKANGCSAELIPLSEVYEQAKHKYKRLLKFMRGNKAW